MEKDWERDVVEFCPKVYRCVDGLNLHLYQEAMAARDRALSCQYAMQDVSNGKQWCLFGWMLAMV